MADRVNNQNPIAGVPTVGTGLSGATTGVKLGYTCPAGRVAVVRYWTVTSISGGGPTIVIQVTIGGVLDVIFSMTTSPQVQQVMIPLNAGDKIEANVTAAIAATTFSCLFGVEEFLAA